jgi:hypothetical protein
MKKPVVSWWDGEIGRRYTMMRVVSANWRFPGLLLVLLLVAPLLSAEEGRKPLLIEGKKTLYQRVLAKPGATMVSVPGKKAKSKAVTPFSVFYVYSRVKLEGQAWVQVGYSSHGTTVGWITASNLLQWNHGLTVAFRDPAGKDRTMLFRDEKVLSKLAATTVDNPAEYNGLYKAATEGRINSTSPVIAIQPKGYVDVREDFYLVPIREFKDVFVGSERGRMLRVSTVPHNVPSAKVNSKATTARSNGSGAALNTGVVFVIDSTLSMDPYISRTRAAVQKIYDDIARSKPKGKVSFGLVAFRDDPAAVAGLDYRTMVFADLDKNATANDFFASVGEVKAAGVSSKDFAEDAYSGIKRAIDGIGWGDFQARYMILITDAGARESNDPLSGSKMSAETLRQLARDNNIAIFVLHLLTPQGEENHESAKNQYKLLSYYPGVGDLYYGVRTGAVGEFGRVLDALTDQLVTQLGRGGTAPSATDDQQLAQLQEKVSKLGFALKMQYLDPSQKGGIPMVFDAWMLDRNPKNPQRKVLDVRVLLTRDQLSDLYQMLREVLETAEEGMLSPRTFLNDIKSLAAAVSRDPEKLAGATRSSGSENLADMGFMKEYIEDLPYTGDVMKVSLEDWRTWPAQKQLTFIQKLEEKVSYYRALHDHTDLWVSLDGGAVDGDSVFPVPLEMLP